MGVTGEFHVPWKDIDPTLQHGGIPGGGLDEEFVGPNVGDNQKTTNISMYEIFRECNDIAAAYSCNPEGNTEGIPSRNAVEEILKFINSYIELVSDRCVSSANRVFQWTHATPPNIDFVMRPVRYPLRNVFMNKAVYYLLGAQVEIAEMNSNAGHCNASPSASARMMAPLLNLKMEIAKSYFDQEIGGELSADEVATILAKIKKPGPTIVPSDESMPLPDQADIDAAKEGINVLQWFPDAKHWTIFAEKRDSAAKKERIFQPEGASRTTEDVSPENPVTPQSKVADIG